MRRNREHTHTRTDVTKQVSSVSCDKDSTESVGEKVVMSAFIGLGCECQTDGTLETFTMVTELL